MNMNITLVGINHKTAPISIREKFYLNVVERELLLAEFSNNPAIVEAVILSTCNRTEIYAVTLSDDRQEILRTLFQIKKQEMRDAIEGSFYIYHDLNAIRHGLQVACGLDSLILGEKQISGQLKEAVELSRNRKMMSRTLNIFFNFALEAGKKARRETSIDFGGVSVSAAAVTTAQRILGTLQGKDVLVIGTGKMGAVAAKHLQDRGVQKLYLMNRSHQKAVDLATQFGGEDVAFWQIQETLEKVDLCICSAGAPHYLIDEDLMKSVMIRRKGRPIVCIDISIPRNIAPEVNSIDGVKLISLDELDKVIEGNLEKRENAVSAVETIIEQKMKEFYQALSRQQREANLHEV